MVQIQIKFPALTELENDQQKNKFRDLKFISSNGISLTKQKKKRLLCEFVIGRPVIQRARFIISMLMKYRIENYDLRCLNFDQ